MRRVLPWVVVVLWFAPAASAQQPAASTDDEARGLFLAGQAAFSDARYEDALRYFRQAYELSGRAGLLYNVAVAANRLRRDNEALEAFEQFLREAPPNHPSRRDAEVRASVLSTAREHRQEAATEEVETQSTTPEAEAPAEASSAPPVEVAPGGGADTTPASIVLGVGAAVAVAGGVMLVVGQADADSVTGAADGTPWANVQAAAGRANLLRNLGWVLAAVGVAGAAAGLTWALVGGSDHADATEATARLSVGPGGVLLEGEF